MAVSASVKESFLALVRLGLGLPATDIRGDIDWQSLQELATQHGLSGVALDGIEQLPEQQRPGKLDLLQWIGEMLQNESSLSVQWDVACKMADVFDQNYIRTYILKGLVIAECYPNPNRRVSTDIDCFLLPKKGNFDAWSLGNELLKYHGCKVGVDFYKHSDFYLQDVKVENHRFMTPCRGNKWLMKMETVLQSLLKEDKGKDKIASSNLCRPPVMASALFIIEHSYSHFMGEGLSWKYVADWVLFEKKHRKEIEWGSFLGLLEEFGLKKFFDSFNMICKFLAGEVPEDALSKRDKKLLDDIWDDFRMVGNDHNFCGKLSLALKTIRSAWKYHYFAVISMPHALWIYTKGYLFTKIPTLVEVKY